MYMDANGDAYEGGYYYYYEDAGTNEGLEELSDEGDALPKPGFLIRQEHQRGKLKMNKIPKYKSKIDFADEFNCLPDNGDEESVVEDPEGILDEILPNLTDGVKRNPKEVQEIRRKKRRQDELKEELLFQKKSLGLACSDLICASCKVNVKEFIHAVVREIDNPEKQTIDTVLTQFCASPEMQAYVDLAIHLCEDAFLSVSKRSYAELLLSHLETAAEVPGNSNEHDWANLTSTSKVAMAQKLVCETTHMCEKSAFTFDRTPKTDLQEQWTNECFVCQNYVYDMQKQLLLMRNYNSRRISESAKGVCDRLNMPPEYDALCRQMSTQHHDELTFMLESYPDKIKRKAVSEITFGDSVCQGVGVCDKYNHAKKAERRDQAPQVFY
jgi:hypothetical protein